MIERWPARTDHPTVKQIPQERKKKWKTKNLANAQFCKTAEVYLINSIINIDVTNYIFTLS